MLTRIEISGFKSFQQFAIDLRPFQVFIGPNGVGKTNLFDAITLLAGLADDLPLGEALRRGRGELSELFTLYPDGTRAKQMTFAAEMLVDKTVPGEGDRVRPLACNRLRYEVTLESRIEEGRERVYVAREGLLPIKETDDRWAKEYLSPKARKARILREKRPPYIETTEGTEGAAATIYRNQDAPGGGREATLVGGLERTALSVANALRYPTIYAARQEMRSWRFLQLHPSGLRAPGPKGGAVPLLPDGSNLPGVLSRLAEAPARLESIARELAGFIPRVEKILITPVVDRDDVLIEIETADKSRFSSRVLSDGTLRMLALVTIKADPLHKGVLCFEEPENGVQAMRMKQIMDVLYALSADLEKDDSTPLRQVLINTHSPGLLAHAPADTVLYMHLEAAERGRATRTIPVRAEMIPDEENRYLTWEQVSQFMDQATRKPEELGL